MRLYLLVLSLFASVVSAGIVVETMTLRSGESASTLVYSQDTGIAVRDNGDPDEYILSFGTNIIYTVGAGGDFETLTSALTFASKRYPLYQESRAGVTLLLKSGFIMSEQVAVYNIDLMFVTIAAEDSVVVINRSAMTRYLGATYPAFFFENCRAPQLNAPFSFDSSGPSNAVVGVYASASTVRTLSAFKMANAPRYGIYAANGSAVFLGNNVSVTGCGFDTGAAVNIDNNSVIRCHGVNASLSRIGLYGNRGSVIIAPACVVTNSSLHGAYIEGGAALVAPSGNFDSAGGTGIFVINSASANVAAATARGAGVYGIRAENASVVNAAGGNFSNSASDNIRLVSASSGDFVNAVATNSGRYGVYSGLSSKVSFGGGNASGAATRGLFAERLGVIDASNVKCRRASTNGVADVVVLTGGQINFSGTTEGGVSQTKNTVTASGIIFQP